MDYDRKSSKMERHSHRLSSELGFVGIITFVNRHVDKNYHADDPVRMVLRAIFNENRV